jgi:amino acid transporter
MEIPRRIARILGPVLVALTLTEAPNLRLFDGNPAPVVYLDGTLLLIAGVAILQAYARWSWSLSSLVTLSGWAFVIAGLYRMAFPAANQLAEGPGTWAVFALLLVIGGLLTFKGYRPAGRE